MKAKILKFLYLFKESSALCKQDNDSKSFSIGI